MLKHLIIILLSVLFMAPDAEACTSAIVSARLNPHGRPLLWKHRDTSAENNYVDYVAPADGAYGYVALFNATDRDKSEAWMGMNDKGFAIMNTASTNLKDDKVPDKDMDKEGAVMTIALRSCVTVDDFQQLLEKLPRPLGVEANFGCIDAEGNGAYFETNNHSFTRFDLADAPDGILIRTNYSHSGRKGEGGGYVREANAHHILAPYVEACEVTPEVLTEVVSRSFYHDLKKRDFATPDGDQWVVDSDFIPRFTTTGTFVVEGFNPEDPGSVADQYVMWCGIGYPPCTEILPVWCREGGVDDDLRGIGEKGRSPMQERIKQRKAEVFSLRNGDKKRYINMRRLINSDGTGYLQTLPLLNKQVYEKFTRRY